MICAAKSYWAEAEPQSKRRAAMSLFIFKSLD
jgi:hypothetical protein